MKPYWIAILFLFWTSISPAQAQHTAGPMFIYINGVNFDTFLTADNLNLKGEELQRAFLQYVGIDDSELGGQALLISNALDSILEERTNGVSVDPDYSKMHEKCREAYDKKLAWHQSQGTVPPAFGKIIHYDLKESPKNEWTGLIFLCTWIGSLNYYFEIEFLVDSKNTMRLHEPPFSGTLDTSLALPTGSAMHTYINQWDYKLHARQGAINYRSIWENNALLSSTHQFYNNLEQKCFDTFYKNPPTGNASDLANQLGYCMGRCDAKVMNTGD